MPPEAPAGVVVGHYGQDVEVVLPGGERLRVRPRRNEQVVVGDRVALEEKGAVPVERQSLLSRRDARGGARAIAANLDLLFVTVAGRPPAPRGYRDRAIVAARAAGIRPLLVVSKLDLADSRALHAELDLDRALREGGIEVLGVSARTGEGLEALRARLASLRGAFVGTSGVGKSSLLNALVPGLSLETGDINRFTRLGRHVTTRSSLHVLTGGGELIDTPGFRDFVPVDLSPADLARHFAGFELALGDAGCRFRNCLHRDEPDCAVRAALEAGRIDPERHDAYLALLADLEQAAERQRRRRSR